MMIFRSKPIPPREAMKVANDQTLVICMLETAEAVELAP